MTGARLIQLPGHSVPVARVKVGDGYAVAVIDTGSDISMIDTSFVREHPASIRCTGSVTMSSLTGVTGTDGGMKAMEYSADVSLGGRKRTAHLVGTDMSHISEQFSGTAHGIQLLLGMDFLGRNGAVIDCGGKRIRFKDDISGRILRAFRRG